MLFLVPMPMTRTVFSIDRAVLQALKDIKAKEGIPEGEQIRRGIQLWLDLKRVKVPKGKKR